MEDGKGLERHAHVAVDLVCVKICKNLELDSCLSDMINDALF